MPEPTTSSAAGGYAAYQLLMAAGIPAGLAAIVVMCWVKPKSNGEWAMALICTFMASVCGGAWVIDHYALHVLMGSGVLGLAQLGGLFFVCGLPGWVLIRAVFAWVDKRKAKDIAELMRDAKRDASSVMGGAGR